jgi:hypothetical protein
VEKLNENFDNIKIGEDIDDFGDEEEQGQL